MVKKKVIFDNNISLDTDMLNDRHKNKSLIKEFELKGLNYIIAVENCFTFLEEYYDLACTYEEYESMSGMIRNQNNLLYGYIGQYFNFIRIPEDSWEKIKKYILDKISGEWS